MAECPACGRKNVAGARFCSACGAAIGAPAVEEVRKTVTVVFCDLAGSTSLGERLDAESVRRAMTRYFEAARVALERHGGTLEKFIGDAVMAVFGAPRLHEDDALRAVRAAAELRDALAGLGDELESELGVRLEARIGVATGEVVTGDHSSRQSFVTGDTVNVAARLEEAAAPGEILVGERTHELVRDAVRVEAAGALSLKGKSELVSAWRLVEVMPDARVFARPTDSLFVGREPELAALREALERAVASQSCHVCTVVGSPGIGKSRLAAELIAFAGEDYRAVVGRCLPYGEGITYWPLVEIVREAAGGVAEIETLLAGDESAALVAARIAGAMGSGEIAPAEEIFWAFRKLFEVLARERPLIVVVDELHWAEPTLLDLLEYLVTFAADAPILLLCLARPELFDARPSWATPRRNAAVITLEPLAEDESSTLVESLARTHRLSPTELPKVVATAEGNPLFLEQLLAYRAEGGNGGSTVPPTIQALLAARIDRLDQDERTVLVRAAVEGKTFHRGAVAELLPEQARPVLGAQLMALVRKELILPDRSDFPGEDGFRFGHILIRDAAYEAAPKELRAEAHERYAAWLERRAGERTSVYEEILGYHLEHAYRCRLELGRRDDDLATRAAERLARAGQRALGRSDIPAAVNLLGRAAALASSEWAEFPGLVHSLGIARMEAGDFEGAEQALTAAMARAEDEGNASIAVRAGLELGRLRLLTGRTTMAELHGEAERAISVLDPLGDDLGLAKAWLVLTDAYSWRSEMANVEQAADRARLHARRAGDAREEADALFWSTTGTLYGERPIEEGIEICERLLAEVGGPMAEVGLLEILAALRVRNGEVAEGRDIYRRSDQLYRELGMPLRAAINLQCWGTSELATGDFAMAETVLRKGSAEYEEIGERGFLSTVVALLTHALCAQGRYDDAVPFLDASQELTSPGDLWNDVLIPSGRARVLAAHGEIAAALELARRALTVVADLDTPELHAQALLALAEVLHRADEPAEETAALQEALRLYEQKGNRPAAERIRAQLAGLAAVPASG